MPKESSHRVAVIVDHGSNPFELGVATGDLLLELADARFRPGKIEERSLRRLVGEHGIRRRLRLFGRRGHPRRRHLRHQREPFDPQQHQWFH